MLEFDTVATSANSALSRVGGDDDAVAYSCVVDLRFTAQSSAANLLGPSGIHRIPRSLLLF